MITSLKITDIKSILDVGVMKRWKRGKNLSYNNMLILYVKNTPEITSFFETPNVKHLNSRHILFTKTAVSKLKKNNYWYLKRAIKMYMHF